MDLRRIEFTLVTLAIVVILGLVTWGVTCIAASSALIVVETSPDRASTYIDGHFVGTTPLTVKEFPAGRHVLRVTKFGHAPLLREIDLRTGKNGLRFDLVELLGGMLRVRSDPSDAEVYVDGELRGRTPLSVKGLGAGGHRVRVSLVNYRDWTEVLDVREDKTAELDITLITRTEAHYLATIQADPTAAVHHVDLAHYYVTRSDWKKAENAFVQALTLSAITSANASYSRNQGYRHRLFQEIKKVFTGSFNYDDVARGRQVVIDALVRSLKTCSDDREYRKYAVYWSLNGERRDVAQDVVEFSLLRYPSDETWVVDALKFAYSWRKQPTLDHLLTIVDDRIAKHPDDFVSHFQRLHILKQKSMKEEAHKEYDPLIRLVKSDKLKARFKEQAAKRAKDK